MNRPFLFNEFLKHKFSNEICFDNCVYYLL